ncbi:MAG: hypothetical protein IKN27_00635 [Selenomonadaceae bacterium]|nr:hypothetical protein [Selenomonadaceae bacterium]
MSKNFSSAIQVAFLLIGVACVELIFKLPEESDTNFIMNIGRYILAHGFPHVDPFTIHDGIQLVAQQWLSGIIFWEAWQNFGVAGLKLTDFIFGALMIILHWRLCFFVSGNKLVALVLSFVVGLITATSIVPRPQIFSTPILLAEIFLLEKFTRTGDARFLIPLPPLSALLINFHAAMWLMFFVLAMPFFFVKSSRHAKFLSATLATSFLFGFANPYGVDAMTYVLRSYGVEIINSHVSEMYAPSAQTVGGKIFYAAEALMIFTFARVKLPWRYVFLSGGLTFLALLHERNLLLFYFAATFPLACAWQNFSVEKIFPHDENFPNRLPLTILFFLLVFVNTVMVTLILQDGLSELSALLKILFFISALLLLYNLLVFKREGSLLHPAILPRKNFSLLITALIVCAIFSVTLADKKDDTDEILTPAIEFILQSERPENISLWIGQGGGGLAGRFGLKYYIDSRAEVFLPTNSGLEKNILKEYLDLITGKIYYADFFSRYDFTHIIVTDEMPLLFNALNRDENFKAIYERKHVGEDKIVNCKIFVPCGSATD